MPLNPHRTSPLPPQPSPGELACRLLEGDRAALSRAITLAESTRADHRAQAEAILEQCLPETGRSVRLGITGVPGVGKSTFIEALGAHVTGEGHRLAVLAIDPSSTRTRGSILGDKTRMPALAANPHAYIRPSPTGGALGGVATTTRETILLCEAAGFDVVVVETVGVGQSETAVRSLVDVFLLLALAGAGDELQGIKRGIMEMADVVAINKADGENREAAQRALRTYRSALHLFPPPPSGWTPQVLTCSSLTGDGIDSVWTTLGDYIEHTRASGYFARQRQEQALFWMREAVEARLKEAFFDDPGVRSAWGDVAAEVRAGRLTPTAAAERLLDLYRP